MLKNATMPCATNGQPEDFSFMIKFVFKFIEKAARRVVKLSNDEWARLEKLAVLLKDATEEERLEIFDAMAEVVFPDEMVGGVIDVRKKAAAETRARQDAYRKNVGQQIKNRRKELRMTQQQLARKAGLPQSHVSRIEAGRHAPTWLTVKRLAKALNTEPSQLDPGFACDDEAAELSGSDETAS